MENKKILVTGGAGYIGSHVVRQLGAGGEDVLTLDNLCTGFREAVTAGELIIGETGDAEGRPGCCAIQRPGRSAEARAAGWSVSGDGRQVPGAGGAGGDLIAGDVDA